MSDFFCAKKQQGCKMSKPQNPRKRSIDTWKLGNNKGETKRKQEKRQKKEVK